ncbi:Glycine betaine-binding protein OpuAC [Lentibacillus sp. JNUCC-1]|uniref:glycine betaine ABC transporter substrate-binding protein n=1 Tax=Lentibacillus sp. JNUCC-1 TaxID=2654513 RepID=UPI00132AABBE|nr:glycine betaine ABC transporter substrate-binding protein [Lentibacillus sp. JNUCC-1]MUV36442.1 Glycine betaine-binding protein OpuAC [Lentibacillus sp. JNUCC-1]
MMKKQHFIGFIMILVLSMLLVACGGNNDNTDNQSSAENNGDQEATNENNEGPELGKKELTIPYVAWARETVVSYLLGEVLEDIGYDVDVKQVETGPMWASVADGSADFTASAWLPESQKAYWDKYKDEVEEVNQTLDEAPLALTVPTYMEDVNSVEDLKGNEELGEQVDWTITGIDAGAGIMSLTEQALEDYELDNWELLTSSEAAMITELQTAMDKKEPIVVTLWKPHWTFGVMDLKMLEDPKGTYGGDGGHISIVANDEMKEYAPAAYQLITQYTETYDMIEELMPKVFADDEDPEKVAREFIDNNPELVEEWTRGITAE